MLQKAMASGNVIIEQVVPSADLAATAAALDLVLRGLPNEIREPFVASLLPAAKSEDAAFGILCRAVDGANRAVGATWGQGKPGSAVTVWPPQWAIPYTLAATSNGRDPLLDHLLAALTATGTTLAQSLLPDRNAPEAAILLRCGFEHLAELDYLSATIEEASHDASSPSAEPSFVPVHADSFDHLAEVVERTYEGTLDCPALDGLRRGCEMLDEYRSVGDGREGCWRFVQDDGENVGCLLLADHPRQQQLELVYMGIVPSARGRGWGESSVREAKRIAATLGRAQIVLAVDAANRPAVAMYERCGFTKFDRRSAFLCKLSSRVKNE
jgi:ribosomal protein S18 acetylase RimI-like enzyme